MAVNRISEERILAREAGFDLPTPEGWCLPSVNQRNNGMVEKWNIGFKSG
jgi:hypothetical protein